MSKKSLSKNPIPIEINIVKKLFKYSSCKLEPISLYKHETLSQEITYTEIFNSYDSNYIALLGTSQNFSILYIWDINNINNYLYSYKCKVISFFKFSPTNETFTIITFNNTLIFYDINTGQEILTINDPNEKKSKIITFNFSIKGNHFYIATEKYIVLWECNTGKLITNIEENSKIKCIKNDLLYSLRDDMEIHIIKFPKNELVNVINIKTALQKARDIINCKTTGQSFFYAIQKGLYKINLTNSRGKKSNLIISKTITNFKNGIKKIVFNEEGTIASFSDKTGIQYWNIKDSKYICTILKEHIIDFYINYEKAILLTIDDISINLINYFNEKKPQKNIWLNKNPNSFLYYKFSNDHKKLFAIVDKNNSILYNIETGLILNKWYNKNFGEKNWDFTCIMSPDTDTSPYVAVKDISNKIKIWNILTNKVFLTFNGFDAYSFCFSSDGNLLCCGCKKGNEIARIYDLSKNDYTSFFSKNINDCKDCLVKFINNDNYIVAIPQNLKKAIIFDSETNRKIYETEELPEDMECYEKISIFENNCFMISGLDEKKEKISVLYRFDNGKIIDTYKNYLNIDLNYIKNLMLIMYENDKDKQSVKLNIIDISDIDRFEKTNLELKSNKSKFLDENVVISRFNNNNYSEFTISDIKNGKPTAVIKYNDDIEKFFEVDIDIDKIKNRVIIRCIKLEELIGE